MYVCVSVPILKVGHVDITLVLHAYVACQFIIFF